MMIDEDESQEDNRSNVKMRDEGGVWFGREDGRREMLGFKEIKTIYISILHIYPYCFLKFQFKNEIRLN